MTLAIWHIGLTVFSSSEPRSGAFLLPNLKNNTRKLEECPILCICPALNHLLLKYGTGSELLQVHIQRNEWPDWKNNTITQARHVCLPVGFYDSIFWGISIYIINFWKMMKMRYDWFESSQKIIISLLGGCSWSGCQTGSGG